MTDNRFGFLLSHHLYLMNDNSKESKKEQPGFDKLYKVRPIIEKFFKHSKLILNQTNIQSIHESMIRFKARCSLK